MPVALTSDDLLARIKARAQVPAADGRLSDAEIFAICDDIIRDDIGLAAYEADEGRHVYTQADATISSGVSDYRIPTRAWAGGVQQVSLVDSNGNSVPLPRVDHGDVDEWNRGGIWESPRWTLVGAAIRLLPTPTDSSYSLRVRYIRRPNRLVAVSSCGLINSPTSTTLTISGLTDTWGALQVIDVIRGTNHADSLGDGIAMGWSDPTLTYVAGTLDTSGAYAVASGDYACQHGTTCVPQVPDVAMRYLTIKAAAEVCDVFGDAEGFARCMAQAQQARGQLDAAIAERSRTRMKIIPRNSPLRPGYGRRSWRRWWGAS